MLYRTLEELHRAIGDLKDQHGGDTLVGTYEEDVYGDRTDEFSGGVHVSIDWVWPSGVFAHGSHAPDYKPFSNERKVVVLQ